jgi:hypothetical protein
MDTIWNIAIGLDMDLQNNPDNEYLKKSEQLINSTRNINFLQFISRNLFNTYPLYFKQT